MQWIELKTDLPIGRGYVAKTDIPRGTVVHREDAVASIGYLKYTPSEMFATKHTITDEYPVKDATFQLTYRLLQCGFREKDTKEKFVCVTPEEYGYGKDTYDPMVHQLVRLVPDVTREDVDVVHGAVLRNFYNLTTRLSSMDYGAAFFTEASYFNHSCEPNAVRFTIGDTIYIVTTKDVTAGDDVCISYIQVNHKIRDTESYSENLEQRLGCRCKCKRCTSRKKFYPGICWYKLITCTQRAQENMGTMLSHVELNDHEGISRFIDAAKYLLLNFGNKITKNDYVAYFVGSTIVSKTHYMMLISEYHETGKNLIQYAAMAHKAARRIYESEPGLELEQTIELVILPTFLLLFAFSIAFRDAGVTHQQIDNLVQLIQKPLAEAAAIFGKHMNRLMYQEFAICPPLADFMRFITQSK